MGGRHPSPEVYQVSLMRSRQLWASERFQQMDSFALHPAWPTIRGAQARRPAVEGPACPGSHTEAEDEDRQATGTQPDGWHSQGSHHTLGTFSHSAHTAHCAPELSQSTAEVPGPARQCPQLWGQLPRGFRSSSSDSDSPSSATAIGTVLRGCTGSGGSCGRGSE